MSNLVTVKVPSAKLEELSSRARRSGAKARRGWVRHVVRVDREQKGGYALIGDEPFLAGGERLLPVGAVVVEADFDGTAKIMVVAHDGVLINIRNDSDGKVRWWSLKTQIVSLCEAVERWQAVSQRELLDSAVRWWEIMAAADAKYAKNLDEARARRAAISDGPAPAVDRAALEAERAALLARLAEIESALA